MGYFDLIGAKIRKNAKNGLDMGLKMVGDGHISLKTVEKQEGVCVRHIKLAKMSIRAPPEGYFDQKLIKI